MQSATGFYHVISAQKRSSVLRTHYEYALALNARQRHATAHSMAVTLHRKAKRYLVQELSGLEEAKSQQAQRARGHC